MITDVVHRSILALAITAALVGLAGCGIRSDFEPRSAVPGVVITTQTTPQTSPDRLVLEPAGSERPRITVQEAFAACGWWYERASCADHKPTRMILARLGSTPSSYADALVWVFEWDNVPGAECGSGDGPDPHPAPPKSCTVYEVSNAMVGDGIELVQMG
jgi:hypothetical protein